uniref:Ethylene-forming enzyme n=1 Tax=Oryza sativa subsp. japonica TaxID=39947 RepID=Q8SB92_ORYSJ|nr:putative ethylene-forming enzyme [Oryza sativa Japonica Group]
MAEVRTIGSLPVPNVQALAGTCNGSDEQIPERYIRTEATCEEVISNYHGDMAIPIIDLNKLLSPQSSEEECVKLRSACQYWGFFQLINHGVPEEVIENFRSNIIEFFSLPLDAKKEYSQLPNSLEGYGQTFVFSEDQKLDWGDMLYLQVIGLSPHTDVVGLTLLLQVNDVQGLQIKRDGKWFSVDALSGAFIVNIGDTLEILSNGKFKSVEHRAMIHPNKERISTALFHYPRDDLLLSPLPEFVKDGKVNYRSISYNDFMMQFFNQKRDGRNRLERLKLEQ